MRKDASTPATSGSSRWACRFWLREGVCDTRRTSRCRPTKVRSGSSDWPASTSSCTGRGSWLPLLRDPRPGPATTRSPVWNVVEYLALFLIVTLHEFGHSLACRQVGGTAERIVLWPLGGVAYVSPRSVREPRFGVWPRGRS